MVEAVQDGVAIGFAVAQSLKARDKAQQQQAGKGDHLNQQRSPNHLSPRFVVHVVILVVVVLILVVMVLVLVVVILIQITVLYQLQSRRTPLL